MQSRNRILDDAARVAGGALETLAGMRREIEDVVRHRIDMILASRDLVTRDEFDAVKEIAVNARAEQQRLEARVVELEEKVARLSRTSARPARRTSSGRR